MSRGEDCCGESCWCTCEGARRCYNTLLRALTDGSHGSLAVCCAALQSSGPAWATSGTNLLGVDARLKQECGA